MAPLPSLRTPQDVVVGENGSKPFVVVVVVVVVVDFVVDDFDYLSGRRSIKSNLAHDCVLHTNGLS